MAITIQSKDFIGMGKKSNDKYFTYLCSKWDCQVQIKLGECFWEDLVKKSTTCRGKSPES